MVSQYELLSEIYSTPDAIGKEKMDKIHKAFNLIDSDGNGTISADEAVEMALKHFNILGFPKKPSVEEALELFKDIDSDGSKEISFTEFTTFMMNTMKQKYMGPLIEHFNNIGLKVAN